MLFSLPFTPLTRSRPVALGLLLLTTAAGSGVGQTYYLDAVNGSDTNPGTMGAPLQTLGAANGLMAPGVTFRLRAGQNFLVNGTPLLINPTGVRVCRYGAGTPPTITGQDLSTCIRVTSRNAVIEDVSVINGTLFDLVQLAGDVTGLLIQGASLVGGRNGLAGSAAGTACVRRCTVRQQWVDGVSLHGSVSLSISDTRFLYVATGNPATGAGDACSVHDTATVSCFNCFFFECKRGAMVNINTVGTSRMHDCVVKCTDAPSVVRQDGGGTTEVYGCTLVIQGAAPTVALLSMPGGIIDAQDTVVLNSSQNPFSGSFFAGGITNVQRCSSHAVAGLHGGVAAGGIYGGDDNRYVGLGPRFLHPTGTLIDFDYWRDFVPGDNNSIQAEL